MNRFLVLSRKLRDVFVDAPADHNPACSPVFLHRIDLDFNSITVKLLCNVDFKYRANLGVASKNHVGWNLSFTRRGYEYFLHELVEPYPS